MESVVAEMKYQELGGRWGESRRDDKSSLVRIEGRAILRGGCLGWEVSAMRFI